MKNFTLTQLRRLSAMLLVALCSHVMGVAQENPFMKFTFTGTGDSEIVESVTVTNLSQPDLEPVTLNGTDILYLADNETITPIERIGGSIGITQPFRTPNPSLGVGTLSFDAKQEGPVRVGIYSTNGMLMESAVLDVQKGRNTARIPGQASGIYIIKVEGQGLSASTRWICGGSKSFSGIALGGAAQWADRPLPVKTTPGSSMPAKVAQVGEAYLAYTPGDVLRVEGTSGELRTIMHVSPQKEGIITIDFFRCKDATGYNYPIMRSGDILWMLEDLHPQVVQGVTRTYVPATWKSIADHAPAMFTSQGRAYYNIHAARMVMPEGWHAPTIDEMKDFLKALNADLSTLGDFVKDRDYNWIGTLVEGPDSIHMQLQPLGYINEEGRLTGANATGAWLTRNTINHGNPVTFEVRATESEFFPQVEHNKGCGFLLRGCRPASSAYAKMIESQFSSASQPMPMVSGPIGEYYTFGPNRYSVFFDYSGWTNSGDDKPQCQQRSGILYKNHNSGGWKTTGKQLVPLDVNGANYMNHLRKVAAQGNGEGYEGVVYATWSEPFRIYYEPKIDGSTGVVNVTIFGDAAHNNSIVDGYASRPLLDKDGNPYMWQMPESRQSNNST
ncbi:MAG: T9SS type A sorting domain-containing protein [Bacteroidaceae bacterium]|nr:T9SS type A sorting domain-containing protein [Bacteroidaceae bacterium]